MSKPDWTEAPDDATHWDTMGAVWCKHLYFWCYGRWNYEGEIHDLAEDRYTPRPVEAWFPIVGERCQVIELPGINIECEILANRCGDYIYYVPEKHTYGMLAAGAFRPIRTQAKTEPATTTWDGTGLPPVGSDQTVFVPSTAISAVGAMNSDSRWEVVAHRGDSVVVCIDEYGRGEYRASMVPARYCRHIPTQAQIDRTQLVKTLNQLRGETDVGVIADAIIEMGFTLKS